MIKKILQGTQMLNCNVFSSSLGFDIQTHNGKLL